MQTGDLKDFDRILWFRKEINVSQPAKTGTYLFFWGLNLGTNEVYINCVTAGTSNYAKRENWFYIRPRVLLPGKNILVIRLFGKEKDAAFEANAADMAIESLGLDPVRYSIANQWEFTFTLTVSEINILSAKPVTAPPNSAESSIFNAKINPLPPLQLKSVL